MQEHGRILNLHKKNTIWCTKDWEKNGARGNAKKNYLFWKKCKLTVLQNGTLFSTKGFYRLLQSKGQTQIAYIQNVMAKMPSFMIIFFRPRRPRSAEPLSSFSCMSSTAQATDELSSWKVSVRRPTNHRPKRSLQCFWWIQWISSCLTKTKNHKPHNSHIMLFPQGFSAKFSSSQLASRSTSAPQSHHCSSSSSRHHFELLSAVASTKPALWMEILVGTLLQKCSISFCFEYFISINHSQNGSSLKNKPVKTYPSSHEGSTWSQVASDKPPNKRCIFCKSLGTWRPSRPAGLGQVGWIQVAMVLVVFLGFKILSLSLLVV